MSSRASLERLLLGWRGRRDGGARRSRSAAFLRDASARWRARRSDADARPMDLVAAVGADAGVTHAALLAWWTDPRAGHGLGARPAESAMRCAGIDPARVGEPRGARRRGDVVLVECRARTVALALPGARADRVEGVDVRGARTIDAGALAREVAVLAPEATPEAGALAALWSRALRESYLGAVSMSEWKGFSSDVTFLLEHWQEYLDVVAVRAQADRELAALRERILAAVRERYAARDGWEATLDEDWILLRRSAWPVPAEEWLAFVVVLSDLESVLSEGGDGWWSALSLPTDGDFDDETFTTLVRAKLDLGGWRAHLANRWPGHALARALPAAPRGAAAAAAIEEAALAEFARYVTLVPIIDQCLRDMG